MLAVCFSYSRVALIFWPDLFFIRSECHDFCYSGACHAADRSCIASTGYTGARRRTL